MLLNYHIGPLVLSLLCVGALVRLVLGGVRFAGFTQQNELNKERQKPQLPRRRNQEENSNP